MSDQFGDRPGPTGWERPSDPSWASSLEWSDPVADAGSDATPMVEPDSALAAESALASKTTRLGLDGEWPNVAPGSPGAGPVSTYVPGSVAPLAGPDSVGQPGWPTSAGQAWGQAGPEAQGHGGPPPAPPQGAPQPPYPTTGHPQGGFPQTGQPTTGAPYAGQPYSGAPYASPPQSPYQDTGYGPAQQTGYGPPPQTGYGHPAPNSWAGAPQSALGGGAPTGAQRNMGKIGFLISIASLIVLCASTVSITTALESTDEVSDGGMVWFLLSCASMLAALIISIVAAVTNRMRSWAIAGIAVAVSSPLVWITLLLAFST